MNTPLDRRPWLTALALVVMTIAVYAPVRDFEFVNYDDNDYVYSNPMVTPGLTARGVITAFTSFHAANWHPLTWISHMIDVELFELEAGEHHAVNLLFHLANALLLYLVLRGLTASHWGSATVALLFALHPLNVETVAWISERKSLLSTFAWLLAIDSYRRWTIDRTRSRYALLVVFFLVGLLTKPMIVTLPATLLLLDVWPLSRLTVVTLHDAAELRRLVKEKLPLFALSAISSVITIAAQSAAKATLAADAYPLSERVINALNAALWYLKSAVAPVNLTVLYPHPLTSGVPASRPIALLSALLFAALLAIAVRQFRMRPWIFVGLGWYLVTLLPVIGIIQVGSQAHADRYAYVPLIGIFVAAVWIVREITSRENLRLIAAAAACVVLAYLAIASRRQLGFWRDSGTLFARAVAVSGGQNPIARKNLASHYSEIGSRLKASGNPQRALDFFRAASELHGESGVLYNEAATLSDLQRYSDAIPLYIRSLSLDPANADGWLNLGDAQVMTADYHAAVTSYRRVLSLRHDKYADYGLAFACARTGDASCSNESLRRLASVDPQLARDAAAMIGQ